MKQPPGRARRIIEDLAHWWAAPPVAYSIPNWHRFCGGIGLALIEIEQMLV